MIRPLLNVNNNKLYLNKDIIKLLDYKNNNNSLKTIKNL